MPRYATDHATVSKWIGNPMSNAAQGVTQPPRVPQVPPATFGFVDNAERINSRACMVGFPSHQIVHAVSGFKICSRNVAYPLLVLT